MKEAKNNTKPKQAEGLPTVSKTKDIKFDEAIMITSEYLKRSVIKAIRLHNILPK